MLNKLNLKRDKIVDIQSALDGCGDEKVDYDEWRQVGNHIWLWQ